MLRVILLAALWLMATARGDMIQMPATMQETLQLGVTAFTNGDYANAAAAFDHLSTAFGKEPQYAPLIPTLLPIHAYACQMSEQPDRAIALYQQFLELPNQQAQRRAFVLFSLAQAYQNSGQLEEAVATYQGFIETAPDSPEAVLSAMRQAELYFEIEDDQKGIDRLTGFAASDRVPASLGMQAQLRALQKALEMDDFAQAQEILFNYHWQVEQMPELAVLTFAALELGNYLLNRGEHDAAIRAYRHVTPRDQLIAIQLERLRALQISWNERQAMAGTGYHAEAIWDDYFRNLITRVQGQLKSLEEAEDYTPGYQMRLGQAFLLAERPREAYLIFRHLAEDESLADDLRGSAHYRWILAANAMENWDDSLAIAQVFLDRYPGHPEAPGAIYLIADACQELKQYRQAIEVLTELLDNYPQHALVNRWLFKRGFNYVLAQDFPAARKDFQAVLAQESKGILADQVRLWDAMSYFFARDYGTAMTQFDAAIAVTPTQSPVYAELLYRRAQTLYSARDYAEALVATDAFIKDYPEHLRTPEARVLRGDILMGAGRLLEASNQFARVGPDAGPLFTYAVFQRGKIQKALESYDLMIEHFTDYVRRDDVPDKMRVAEALYWIGWAREQQGQPEVAFPLFIEALAEHGNDVKAGETLAILQALQKLHQRYHAGELRIAADIEDPFGLLTTPNFDDWLLTQLNQANDAGQWTWFARINIYRAQRFRQQGDYVREGMALLEVAERVPMEDLDPEGLAMAGDQLLTIGSTSAQSYFAYLMEEYPRSMQLGAAYYGLARLAVQAGNIAEAEAWLNRFEAVTAFHPAGPQVKLLRGQLLVELGQIDQAISVLQDLLRLKSARGRPHAQALLGIAAAHLKAGDTAKAIAHYQRVYTLYRAYPEEVVAAYVASAPLFEQRGDLRAAYNTWRELLANPRLEQFTEAREHATIEMARLGPILPPEPEPETVANATDTPPTQEAPL